MSVKTFDPQLFSRTLGNCEIEFYSDPFTRNQFQRVADKWLKILNDADLRGTWKLDGFRSMDETREIISHKNGVVLEIRKQDGRWKFTVSNKNGKVLCFDFGAYDFAPRSALIASIRAFFSC
jgi:hypothetical protein